MKCIQCSTENLEGSKFCKECGARLTDATAAAEPTGQLAMNEIADEDRAQEVKSLLQSAVALIDDDDFDGAMRDAMAAAELEPDSALAHQLLVTLCEREGDYEGALEHQGRVVELNPSAYSERQALSRLQRLKARKQVGGIFANPLKDRSPQAIAAFLTVCLVLTLGLAYILGGVRSQKRSEALPADSAASLGLRPNSLGNDRNQSAYATTSRPLANPPVADLTASRRTPMRVNPPPQGLPEDSNSNETRLAPLTPPAPNASTPAGAGHNPVPPRRQEALPKPPPPPPMVSHTDRTGNTYISNQNVPKPPSQPPPGTTVSAKKDSYAEGLKGRIAVAAVERKGKLQQILAIHYRNTGQVDGARQEFRHAIASYQAQMNAGNKAGDPETAIGACRLELEGLGQE